MFCVHFVSNVDIVNQLGQQNYT